MVAAGFNVHDHDVPALDLVYSKSETLVKTANDATGVQITVISC